MRPLDIARPREPDSIGRPNWTAYSVKPGLAIAAGFALGESMTVRHKSLAAAQKDAARMNANITAGLAENAALRDYRASMARELRAKRAAARAGQGVLAL